MSKITIADFKKLHSKKGVVLIDVREPGEHRSEKIPGAHSIPLGQIDIELLPSGAEHIVLHCQSGRRSAEALKKLKALNPKLRLYDLEGGISSWKELGHETEKGKSNIIAIDRQMQIVAGILILTGVTLGMNVNESFYYLAGFVGLGLTFAGITGWCGMIKLLALMPWNR